MSDLSDFDKYGSLGEHFSRDLIVYFDKIHLVFYDKTFKQYVIYFELFFNCLSTVTVFIVYCDMISLSTSGNVL